MGEGILLEVSEFSGMLEGGLHGEQLRSQRDTKHLMSRGSPRAALLPCSGDCPAGSDPDPGRGSGPWAAPDAGPGAGARPAGASERGPALGSAGGRRAG